MTPSLAHLLNQAPEFGQGAPIEPAQQPDTPSLASEPNRKLIELSPSAALEAVLRLQTAMFQKLAHHERRIR